MSQPQEQTRATDIRAEEIKMSINLPYFEGTSETLRRMLRFQKIKSGFYAESTFHKLLCKPNNRVATEEKNVYESDCNNCKVVYFSESKRSLKSRPDKHKRFATNCDCGKNEIAKHCWEADHNFS